MPMIFKVFSFTRPPNPVAKPIEEKEEESDEYNFDNKNSERDKTKSKDTRMRKESRRKHKEDVNPTIKESSTKAFNNSVAYKRTRLNMMRNREVTLPPDAM
ncbi:unnamed protein product [Lactuca saligna]|uniref:Uncharacterized protein n=1 Tax=Lactuca saligna TaxID=75948 RepID=A0AA35ZWA7_LACSI|nr:unnamed protein product [Lactuca saligna]